MKPIGRFSRSLDFFNDVLLRLRVPTVGPGVFMAVQTEEYREKDGNRLLAILPTWAISLGLRLVGTEIFRVLQFLKS
jgi:hypothetical protein